MISFNKIAKCKKKVGIYKQRWAIAQGNGFFGRIRNGFDRFGFWEEKFGFIYYPPKDCKPLYENTSIGYKLNLEPRMLMTDEWVANMREIKPDEC